MRLRDYFPSYDGQPAARVPPSPAGQSAARREDSRYNITAAKHSAPPVQSVQALYSPSLHRLTMKILNGARRFFVFS